MTATTAMTASQQKGPEVPLGADPPTDVTIGELWRTLSSMSNQIEHLSDKVEDLPARISFDLGSKYDERLTGMESRDSHMFSALDNRVTQQEVWRSEAAPLVLLMQERVALLQRLVYGAVGCTLLAFVAAILSSVTHH